MPCLIYKKPTDYRFTIDIDIKGIETCNIHKGELRNE